VSLSQQTLHHINACSINPLKLAKVDKIANKQKVVHLLKGILGHYKILKAGIIFSKEIILSNLAI
jgi:hypothetical protein